MSFIHINIITYLEPSYLYSGGLVWICPFQLVALDGADWQYAAAPVSSYSGQVNQASGAASRAEEWSIITTLDSELSRGRMVVAG